MKYTDVMLDRDGTLIVDKHYLHNPDAVELLPGVANALAELNRQGVRLFLVSNQSGVGRGMFTKASVHACNERMAALLRPHGVVFTDMAYCPHAPEDACPCRKPGIGMWHTLMERHALHAGATVMVGDKREDMAFGARAHMAARVLVTTGKGAALAQALGCVPAAGEVLLHTPKAEDEPDAIIPSMDLLPKALFILEKKKENVCSA